MKFTLLTSAAFALSAAAASAGGFTTAPEPVVVEPVAMPVTLGNWQGGYAGATLGYGFNGDDEFGFDYGAGEVPSRGKLEVSGWNGDLHAGYRWQRDRWVFGPELSIMGGAVDDSFDLPAGTIVDTDGGLVDLSGAEVESKVKSVLALKFKTGYEVQPDMLVFGTVGYQRGDFDLKVAGEGYSYKADGYVLGLGVERMINDRWSVTGEIEHNEFDKEEVDLGGGVHTNASPSFTNVKMGVNFKF